VSFDAINFQFPKYVNILIYFRYSPQYSNVMSVAPTLLPTSHGHTRIRTLKGMDSAACKDWSTCSPMAQKTAD
jgi:hypothetical protein